MMKKIVIIKHFGHNSHYLFSVPDNIQLNEKDMVLVSNRHGEQTGVCVCDSFLIEESPLKALMWTYEAKEPLAPVIGKFELNRFE